MRYLIEIIKLATIGRVISEHFKRARKFCTNSLSVKTVSKLYSGQLQGFIKSPSLDLQ